ncbi:hypothetical protein LAD12857_27560 [Lacrimispora amygdalina]|uniref:Uncharacterized protein n=1 Tax=Lacrimispora amygdalina TaxID=253257 RepID=A0ABQ5M7A5_9FIRM
MPAGDLLAEKIYIFLIVYLTGSSSYTVFEDFIYGPIVTGTPRLQ